MENKGTRYRRKRKGKTFTFLFLIIFLFLFIFSGVKIIKYIIDANKNEKIFDEIEKNIVINKNKNEEDDKYIIDFNELKKKNSDTVGFLKVNGTDISHVVVHAKDNNFYLYNNFYKENNAAGWIFADYRNKFDGSDKNIVIYGHNMRNGSMFSSLKNVLSEEWFKNIENRKILFITEDKENIYEIFSVYEIQEEDYYMKTDFSGNEFKEYIDKVKSRSKYDFNIEVNDKDNLITLSTCGNSNKTRVVVHGKKN